MTCCEAGRTHLTDHTRVRAYVHIHMHAHLTGRLRGEHSGASNPCEEFPYDACRPGRIHTCVRVSIMDIQSLWLDRNASMHA
jgi:hypothetical protein